MRRYEIALAGMLFLPLGLSLAADGATPIWEPTTITEPGKYVVTRNITSPTAVILNVATDNVQIDLNGFTLRGGAQSVVRANSIRELTIENGNIVAGDDDGVELTNVTVFAIRNLLITKSGGNEIGILLSQCKHGVVETNEIRGNFELSLWLANSSEIVIRQNVLNHSDCEGTLVIDGDYCMVVDNSLGQCSAIEVRGSGNRVTGNNVYAMPASFFAGITVTGARNYIADNTSIDNGGYGLFFTSTSSDNVYRGNVARGNGGSFCSGTTSGSDFCDEGSGNTSHGDNYLPGPL